MNQQIIFNLLSLVGVPLFIALWRFGRRIDKQVTDVGHATALIAQKLESIEKQFGPNAGGLRQAVNEMSRKVDVIETRTNDLCVDVAELTGRFDQHIKEGNRV